MIKALQTRRRKVQAGVADCAFFFRPLATGLAHRADIDAPAAEPAFFIFLVKRRGDAPIGPSVDKTDRFTLHLFVAIADTFAAKNAIFVFPAKTHPGHIIAGSQILDILRRCAGGQIKLNYKLPCSHHPFRVAPDLQPLLCRVSAGAYQARSARIADLYQAEATRSVWS